MSAEHLVRFTPGASPEERQRFARELIAALDRLEVAPGQGFVIAPDTSGVLDANALGAFQRESETSRQAALDNYPRSGKQRHRVLLAIARAGEYGRTREELAAELHLPDNSVRPRVRELIEGGWVRATERTRTTVTRSKSEVLALTPKGIYEVAQREGALA